MLLSGLGIVRRDTVLLATSAILLGDWWLCTLGCFFFHDKYPWAFFGVVDWLAALAIYGVRRSSWQSLIMLTYTAELLIHGTYGASLFLGTPDDVKSAYSLGYDLLWAIAWAQVVLCGAWTIYDTLGRGFIVPSSRVNLAAGCPSRASSEEVR